MMKLEQIGFYTLTDQRAATASQFSKLSRCELLLTSRCNFRCPYCRQTGGPDIKMEDAKAIVSSWASHGLKAIRFSGGEPTLYCGLVELVALAKREGIERIAISTNGSANPGLYTKLIAAGANDFSVSLDACCAEDGDRMAGVVKPSFHRVVETIKSLSTRVYTTVGVVLTQDNASQVGEIIRFADSLGVTDIRIIPAAQCDDRLRNVEISSEMLAKYPILQYRIDNVFADRQVRGLTHQDPHQCGLVLDDMAICGNQHYPCIIYLREGGKAIGDVGDMAVMRGERQDWYERHNTLLDPICSRNCLDVCVDYNRKFAQFHNLTRGCLTGCTGVLVPQPVSSDSLVAIQT